MSLQNILTPNNLALYCGSASLSSPASTTSQNFILQPWTVTTIGTLAGLVASYNVPLNSSVSFNTLVTGTVTAGSLINSGLYRNTIFSYKNVAGTLSLVGAAVTPATFNDTGLNAVTVSGAISSNTAQVYVTGIIGQTIYWSGITIIQF